jgi:hypothetical protein
MVCLLTTKKPSFNNPSLLSPFRNSKRDFSSARLLLAPVPQCPSASVPQCLRESPSSFLLSGLNQTTTFVPNSESVDEID